MKVLDLFSGIGGFSLGLERAGMETVAFCEIEDYPRKVLAKHWPNIPVANDVRKLTYNRKTLQLYHKDKVIYVGSIDVICGGFPCQDISVAGKGAGIKEGTRSGLWSECARLLREVRPKYAIFENVTNLLNGNGGDWFKRVLWDISQVGYDAEWHCISASELGAHHHRDRAWIIADPKSKPERGLPVRETKKHPLPGVACKDVADTPGQRQQGQREPIKPIREETAGDRKASIFKSVCIPGEWSAEPDVGRVAYGVSERLDRLKGLGNAVVPQIPEIIGRAIMSINH